uniref:cAMP-independent regulatory protein pac2 n=1 Tax=Melanopsichium pennsylvanicum 4 TaxID=1398559 RepID=A0A077RAH4_9BASI|nr:conserved hypothetical protein [Melanopsichium pennsylvanicum 4]
MGSNQAATFIGYVHSTRDALLIFEAVRRGQLPKITRRLRDEERKMIQSGTIFVFDEAESSIKRWTDGMIWSPSRILNNFLVYREVEKKDPKPASDQPPFATSETNFALSGQSLNGSGNGHQHPSVRSVPLTLMSNTLDAQMVPYKQEHDGYHALDCVASSSNNQGYPEHDQLFGNHPSQHNSSHAQTHAQAAGLVGLIDDGGLSSPTKREAELDRTIVGSLTSSYPFVRDGLCKKTISIQVEGSTQHLISYYKIEDVQNGRLTIPSNLPEMFSFSISPIFLNKSNFRYPPVVEIGLDGLPRYVGESTDSAMRPSGHASSGNESYSSGSEARHDGLTRAASRSLSLYSPAPPSDAHTELYSNRYPHQIGGDGMLPTSATLPSSSTSSLPYRSRRASDAPRRKANSRYEPYQQVPTFGHSVVAQSLYSNAPSMDHGPISPGYRALLPPSRGYNEAGQQHAPDHVSFGMHRQDAQFLDLGPVVHAEAKNETSHPGHLDQQQQQQHAAVEQIQHHNPQQSFQAGAMMPFVPSQPTRNLVSYSATSDFIHGRSDAAQVKKEQADPFHFSSRLTRGSWDSNQPSQPNSFVHSMQQPPATSQGLTAVPFHSQSNFGGLIHGRLAGSPPNTSSSHDSHHSYVGARRIEELVDGVNPPTATRLDDSNYSSRPMSRAANDLDGHQQSVYSQQQQQQLHPPQEQDNVDLDQQAFGRHTQDGSYASTHNYAANKDLDAAQGRHEQSWSDPVQDSYVTNDIIQPFSSRPGTSHDQGFQHHQFCNDSGHHTTEDSGLERVMLTRPAA